MPRQPRTLASGQTYHFTARGTNRQDIFRDDGDRRRFVARFAHVGAERRLSVLAYCLMTNHIHVVVSGDADDLSAGMRDLLGGHAQYFNRRYERSGHLFGGRYHHVHIGSDEQFAAALRYVALNPVRAGIVNRPEEWPWGSYAAIASGQIHAGIVDLNGLRKRLPGSRSSLPSLSRHLAALVTPGLADAQSQGQAAA